MLDSVSPHHWGRGGGLSFVDGDGGSAVLQGLVKPVMNPATVLLT